MQNDGVQPGSEVHASLAPCSPPSGVWVGLVEGVGPRWGYLQRYTPMLKSVWEVVIDWRVNSYLLVCLGPSFYSVSKRGGALLGGGSAACQARYCSLILWQMMMWVVPCAEVLVGPRYSHVAVGEVFPKAPSWAGDFGPNDIGPLAQYGTNGKVKSEQNWFLDIHKSIYTLR